MRLFCVLLTAISLGTPVALAQTPYTHAQTKAANLARMRAEALNGGLRFYRSDRCMYVTRGVDCLVSADERGFLFRFQGGEPGWQQQTPPQPTLETEVLVSIDGDEILAVPYNGPKR